MTTATPTDLPTTPLPSAARAAIRRLELKLTVSPEIVSAVTVYETAAVHAAELASVAVSGRMSDLDADSLAAAEDLMAGARATLTAAGQLHLVESTEHGKTKPPLPVRPPRPHPHAVGAVAR